MSSEKEERQASYKTKKARVIVATCFLSYRKPTTYLSIALHKQIVCDSSAFIK